MALRSALAGLAIALMLVAVGISIGGLVTGTDLSWWEALLLHPACGLFCLRMAMENQK